MSDQFEFKRIPNSGSGVILQLKGRLETAAVHELRDTAHEIMSRGDHNLVLNLGEVEFVSSTGLGTFLLLTEEFKEAGGRIILAEPSRAVLEVVSLLNLDQFLNVEDSVEEALALVEV